MPDDVRNMGAEAEQAYERAVTRGLNPDQAYAVAASAATPESGIRTFAYDDVSARLGTPIPLAPATIAGTSGPGAFGSFVTNFGKGFGDSLSSASSALADEFLAFEQGGFYATTPGRMAENTGLFFLDEAERFSAGGLGATQTAATARDVGGFLSYVYSGDVDNLGAAQAFVSSGFEAAITTSGHAVPARSQVTLGTCLGKLRQVRSLLLGPEPH